MAEEDLKTQLAGLLGLNAPGSAPAAATAPSSAGIDPQALGAAIADGIRQAFGGGQAAPAAPAAPQTLASLLGAQPQRPPVTNSGGPATPQRFSEETSLFDMTPEDRAHVLKTKGPAFYKAKLQRDAKGRKITFHR